MHRVALVVALLSGSAFAQLPDHDPPPLYTCKEPPPSTKITATFQPETQLKDLVTWVMGFTCRNVVVPSDVLARVPTLTIAPPAAMTPKQALQLFVDAARAAGLVVVLKPDTMIVKLGPKLAPRCPAAGAPTPPPTSTLAEAPTEAVDLATGITKIDATHYVVSKALLEQLLANPLAMAKGARVVPSTKDGKANGFTLYAVRPASVFARIGLQSGDTITAINGFEMSSADKALEVYAKLREASTLELEVERKGRPLAIEVKFR